MTTKEETREVEVVYCDICGTEIDEEAYDSIHQCAKCGKDICSKHTGDNGAELGLCQKCSEKFEIDELANGSEVLWSKKTGRRVKMWSSDD
jgi:predicted RNA-binding Zn-ribbon protein involved in translation (DUF1610 family)